MSRLPMWHFTIVVTAQFSAFPARIYVVNITEFSRKMIFLPLCFFILNQHTVEALLSDLKTVFDVAYDIYAKLNDAHDTYKKLTSTVTLDSVFDKVGEVVDTVNEIGNKLEKKIDTAVSTLLHRLPFIQKINSRTLLLDQHLARIDDFYADFDIYIKDKSSFNNDTLQGRAKSFTSTNVGDVFDTVSKMHDLIVPRGLSPLRDSILLLLAADTKENDRELCDTFISAQQKIYNVYTTVVLAEIKAYAMVGFGYVTLEYFNNISYMGELKVYERKMELRIEQYINVAKVAMQHTTQTLRRCDPPTGHARGTSFYEFERFALMWVAQETALNEWQSCNYNCYNLAEPTQVYVGCEGFECTGSSSTCYGTVTGCEQGSSIDALGVSLCEFLPPDPRRYQYIRDGWNTWYGDHERDCDGDTYVARAFKTKSGRLCDPCICVCIEDNVKSPSYHFISLRAQVSNINENMVITGAKLIMISGILHINVQQGQLKEDASVDPDSTAWIPVEKIEYDRETSESTGNFTFYKEEKDGSRKQMETDVDVAVLKWNARTVYLDDLKVPLHHVVTGLRFALINAEVDDKQPIELEIQATPFNYSLGTLENISSTIWVTAKNMKGVEKDYDSERSAHPMPKVAAGPKNSTATYIESKANSYIEIYSSAKDSDAGQTTVPLVDGLEIFTYPPVPLSGVNLVYKAQQNCSGFLSLVLSSFNRIPYMITTTK